VYAAGRRNELCAALNASEQDDEKEQTVGGQENAALSSRMVVSEAGTMQNRNTKAESSDRPRESDDAQDVADDKHGNSYSSVVRKPSRASS
jgi:hypothetical protein